MTAYHFALPMALGKRILDYGCGTGYGTNFLYRRATPPTLTGVDVSDAAIAFCKASYDDIADSFFLLKPGRLPFADDSFELITLFQVIEHVQDDHGLIGELHRVLAPAGVLLITTPNVEFSGEDPLSPSNPHHIREYDSKSLSQLCTPIFHGVTRLGVHGSLRMGGAGIGLEIFRPYRALRRLSRSIRRRPLYTPPCSLADFDVTARRTSQALDLLFICRKQ
jgi:SAM-dependent methyltransferase